MWSAENQEWTLSDSRVRIRLSDSDISGRYAFLPTGLWKDKMELPKKSFLKHSKLNTNENIYEKSAEVR